MKVRVPVKRIKATRYKLWWVAPNTNQTALSLEELNQKIGPLYARVVPGISNERASTGQIAIRLFGAADEGKVLAALAESKYTVVDRELRLCGHHV